MEAKNLVNLKLALYKGEIQCTKCGITINSGSTNNNRKCPKGGSCTWRVVLR
jgi:predicted RNA-binding Zn-ribbon protein involved in translation (DUF1610 family)